MTIRSIIDAAGLVITWIPPARRALLYIYLGSSSTIINRLWYHPRAWAVAYRVGKHEMNVIMYNAVVSAAKGAIESMAHKINN